MNLGGALLPVTSITDCRSVIEPKRFAMIRCYQEPSTVPVKPYWERCSHYIFQQPTHNSYLNSQPLCYTNHFWSWNLYFLRSMISNRINGAWNSENKNWKINQLHDCHKNDRRQKKNWLPSHTLYCIINYKTNNWLPRIEKTAWTL